MITEEFTGIVLNFRNLRYGGFLDILLYGGFYGDYLFYGVFIGFTLLMYYLGFNIFFIYPLGAFSINIFV